jgi:hypothetical protein
MSRLSLVDYKVVGLVIDKIPRKYSLIFAKSVSSEEEKFYNIDARGQCYKTFYGRKL